MVVYFTGMLLSLAGIPLTVGFIGKFYVFFQDCRVRALGTFVVSFSHWWRNRFILLLENSLHDVVYLQ